MKKNWNERLKELRKDTDLRQKDIAAILGIRYNVYQRYEYGERLIPIDLLIHLTEIYSTSADYILGLTNDQRPYKRAE